MSDITYTWGIAQLECAPIEDDLSNVVRTVHWTLSATDGTYSASAYGSIGLGSPDAEDFIAYDELTKEDVVEWVEAALNAGAAPDADTTPVEQMMAGLAGNIEHQHNPPIVTPGLPWAN